ncbi:hypothetical protein UFOVP378_19 [uncultured Caudovirales phage]|uniref:DNA transfer protein n=1 Tax=uncultured Caudovirales phage TaxID=2100421 RepID=A0A6J7X2Z3_9CAUD|nr:hypothetical protein UFOVP378_19 [uncultured Caudovirales phage]
MNGLLDIFGTGGTDTLSLLGMSPEAIQRGRDDAQAQALYSLAGSLLSGGPTGLSIVRGLQQGSQAYKNAMQGQLQEQFQGFQLQDALRKRKMEEDALKRQQAIDRAVAGSYQPAQAAAPAQFYGEATQMPLMDDEGQMMPGATAPVAARAAGLDLQSLAPLLERSPEGRKTLNDLLASRKAMRPETFSLAEGTQQFERDPFTGQVRQVAAGAPKTFSLAEGATQFERDPSTGQIRQVATGAQKREPIQFQDLGNVVIGIQNGQEVLRLPKGLAPQRPEAAPSLQTIETDTGVMAFNPKTGQVSPVLQDGKPVMGKNVGSLTEGQGNSVTYGLRMKQSDDILKPLENAGLKDTGKIRSGVSGTLGAVPLIGEALARGSDNIFNTLPGILGGLSPEQQKVIQARTNFITAILRKESGASISPTEFATAEKNYFPAPGDPEEVVRQKQASREAAIKGMKISAGPGAKFIDQGQAPAFVGGDLASQAAAELERRQRGGR